MIPIVVCPEGCAAAAALAARLGLELAPAPQPAEAALRIAADGSLRLEPPADWGPAEPLRIDLRKTSRGDPRSSLLARAIGVPRGVRTVVDATAGLGTDAIELLRAGCEVTLCERAAWLAAMLEAALDRPDVFDGRAHVEHGDAREVLEALETRPDAVYLDPMFADRAGKSAQPRQAVRLLRALCGDGAAYDAELLAVARRVARRRVVVKRRANADPLPGAGPAPNAVRGKLVRFDLYPPTAT